jgi:iron complex transport system substrate-binding protein
MPFLTSAPRVPRALILAMWLLCASIACRPAVPARTLDGPPERIVSLAPSATEVLVSLGLADRIVGATRYCALPPEAAAAVRVGGYLDINYESILRLEPELVVLIQDHGEAAATLGELGLATVQVDQHDVSGILGSIEQIATRCGAEEEGRRLAAEVRRTLDRVAVRTGALARPSTLVVVGREAGAGSPRSVWVAGRETFYDDVLRLAGGANAAGASVAAYPELSREGLLHLDPEVIIDLLADLPERGVDLTAALDDWTGLSVLRAVRTGRVHPLDHPYAVIPGPGVVELVEDFARILHPEVGS